MFLFPKSILFISLKMVISRAFRTSFPASNALKSNMAANAEFQDLAASVEFKIEPNTGDTISRLYPKVDESEAPLPRSWSPKDKSTFIGLSHSQTNLRVHYKGRFL